MADLVVKWKKHYLLICELVASLNDFLGKPLLIFIAYAFISFVGYTFYVLHEYFSSNQLQLVGLLEIFYSILKNGLCIISLAFVSEKISLEVSMTSQLS